MFFYKVYFKDGSIEYYALSTPVRCPKIIDPECIKIQHIGVFRFIFGYVHSLFAN